jgi:hypothetical protein
VKTLLAVVALVAGFNAYAEESSTASSETTSKAKVQELKSKQQAPKSQEDIDNEITNAKMRAEAGSKSKHSFSFVGGYSGGSLMKPLDALRPELAPGQLEETKTSLDGGISYRYRLSPKDSISVGAGIQWTTPGREGAETEVNDPNVSYSRAFKVGKVQNIFSAGSTKYTSAEAVKEKHKNFDFGVGQTALMEIGTTGWQLGLAADVTYMNYSEYNPKSWETMVGIYPFVEYAFNDTYNFRTVYRGNTYINSRANKEHFTQLEPTQSLGLGIAATRDIFLYPNVQWVWRDIDAEKTNVALSATMNFF